MVTVATLIILNICDSGPNNKTPQCQCSSPEKSGISFTGCINNSPALVSVSSIPSSPLFPLNTCIFLAVLLHPQSYQWSVSDSSVIPQFTIVPHTHIGCQWCRLVPLIKQSYPAAATPLLLCKVLPETRKVEGSTHKASKLNVEHHHFRQLKVSIIRIETWLL